MAVTLATRPKSTHPGRSTVRMVLLDEKAADDAAKAVLCVVAAEYAVR